VKLALCIVHNWRELVGGHIGLSNAFHKRGLGFENSTVMLLGVEYADWQIQVSAHYSHRLDQIGIIRNKYGYFKFLLICLMEQMGSFIYV